MAESGDIVMWSALGLGIASVIITMVFIGFSSPDKDANEIRKNLGIAAGVCGGGILIFAIAAYIYFSTHVNYLTPFLLITTFINMFLSVFAVAASTVKITSA